MRLAVFIPCYNQASKDVKRAQEVQLGNDGVERREQGKACGEEDTVGMEYLLGSPIF